MEAPKIEAPKAEVPKIEAPKVQPVMPVAAPITYEVPHYSNDYKAPEVPNFDVAP